MKSVDLSRLGMAVAMAALVVTRSFAADTNRQNATPDTVPALVATQQPQAAETVKRTIVVSLADRKLALLENGKVVRIYRVAVGKPSTPSLTGEYTIANRVENPTYYHHGKIIQPGPGNPVGNRWMGLNVHGYGIHGTNAPGSIGRAVSHGCIRMGKGDIEDLFSRVRVGDTVELVNTRNAETAQIFGDGPKPLATQPAVETVTTTPVPAMPSSSTPSSQDVLLNSLARTGLTSPATFGLIGAL
ncbi:MAG TPA: L,D-transpeptidase [Terracidiphilus sp.]